MFNNINNNMNQINNMGMNIPSFNNNMVNINNNFGFINNNFNNNFNISYNIQKINNININKAKLSKLNNNIIIRYNKNNIQYFAHCLSPIDEKWYTYNDAMVNVIDNFQKNIIDTGIHDILFYKKIE